MRDYCNYATYRLWLKAEFVAVSRCHTEDDAATFRPALHITGCWIHGGSLEFAVADEDQKNNSEAMIEIMSRAIEGIYIAHHNQLPMGLHVQSDNITREAKNQFCCRWLIQLVLLRVFRWTALGCLISGHSPDSDAHNPAYWTFRYRKCQIQFNTKIWNCLMARYDFTC